MIRIGIVIGEFHKKIAEEMLERAKKMCTHMGASCDKVVWVPGTYETPLPARELLKNKDLDAIAVLGYIEKGSTLHGEQMGVTISKVLKDLELEYSKPIGIGIIGPGATEKQALERLDYGAHAVEAAIKMVSVVKEL